MSGLTMFSEKEKGGRHEHEKTKSGREDRPLQQVNGTVKTNITGGTESRINLL